MRRFKVYTDRQGRQWASLSEYWTWHEGIRNSGLHVIHEPILQEDSGDWRKPDWLFPCTCGHHGVVWEVCGMLSDPDYRRGWLYKRLPWYQRNAGRYLLIMTSSLDISELDGVLDLVRRWTDNDCERMHLLLERGSGEVLCTIWEQRLQNGGQLAA